MIRFAELIKSVIRENDLAGRMGGDEFVAFLQNVEDEKILQVKSDYLNEKILIVARKLLGEEMQIPLGTSIGAVFVPSEGRDFTTLYKKADKALYEVKKHDKHSLAVFGEKNQAENNSIGELSQVRMILGERNIESYRIGRVFRRFRGVQTYLSNAGSHGQFSKGLNAGAVHVE